jgi:hypothetical protein
MKPQLRRGAAVLAAALLGGCAQLPPLRDIVPGTPGASGIAVHAGVSRRYVEIVGPPVQHAAPFLGVAGTNYFVLRSWLDRDTGIAYHQLYVSDSYAGAPRGWDTAATIDGRALRVVAVSRNKIACDPSCSWTEEFAAEIPDALLRASPAGLTVDFAAHSGAAMRIALSAEQIAAQLQAVATERRRLGYQSG